MHECTARQSCTDNANYWRWVSAADVAGSRSARDRDGSGSVAISSATDAHGSLLMASAWTIPYPASALGSCFIRPLYIT